MDSACLQKIGFQRKASEADVEVEFNPANYDPVRLYIYAYEMGFLLRRTMARDAVLLQQRYDFCRKADGRQIFGSSSRGVDQ